MPYVLLSLVLTAVAIYLRRDTVKYAVVGFGVGVATFVAFYWLISFGIWAKILPSDIPVPPSVGEIRYWSVLVLGVVYMGASTVIGALIELVMAGLKKPAATPSTDQTAS